MAYGKDPKVEVESLAKRFPKRGIDPTIPEAIRLELMDRQRQEELDKGIKAHESRKLAKGGSVKGHEMKKGKRYESGGMTASGSRYPIPDPVTEAPPPVRQTPPMPTAVDTPPPPPPPPPPEAVDKRSRFVQRPLSRRLPMVSGPIEMRKGGEAKAYAGGGKTGGASSRADGCAQRGKTKGRMV